jgi:serine/threonine protein kinase
MIGKIIADKYKILGLLGEGGFGTTYLASHTVLDKKVVFKISRTSDESFTERFFKEAQVHSKIDHPRIVGLHDSGQLDDGRAYLVLDWIEGVTLAEVLKDGPLPHQNALLVARALAEGLSVIHQMNILHRDIKPSNIILPTADGKPSFEEAMLADLGVFGELVKKSFYEQAMTVSGQLYGTPIYMSPEQILAKEQTASSDIYGLGVVLYEMIYGKLPLWTEGDTEFSFLKRVVTEEVQFPQNPKVPEALGSFILSCLMKDPQDRPGSGGIAYEEINDLLQSLESGKLVHEEIEEPLPSPESIKTKPAPSEILEPKKGPASLFFRIAMGIIIIISLLIVAILMWKFRYGFLQAGGFILGFLLIAGGILLSMLFRKLFSQRKTEIEKDASKVLFGTQSRENLSNSLAIEVDEIVLKCKSIDQKILGLTMAQMINEYQVARSSSDRQAALMNVVQLLEKLRIRISPWYVKQEKLVTFLVSSVGIISGIVSIILSILKVVNGSS